MDLITFLLLLIWLACGVLVVRFVVKTGGTKVGAVAHWFGGAFVMFGIAIALIVIYANMSTTFGGKVDAYLQTHRLHADTSLPLVEDHVQDGYITVYRRGTINTVATRVDGRLVIDEHQTVRTSLWWMLWSSDYHSATTK